MFYKISKFSKFVKLTFPWISLAGSLTNFWWKRSPEPRYRAKNIPARGDIFSARAEDPRNIPRDLEPWFLGHSAQQLSSAQRFRKGSQLSSAQLSKLFSQLSSLSSGKSLCQLSSAQLSYFFQNLQLWAGAWAGTLALARSLIWPKKEHEL